MFRSASSTIPVTPAADQIRVCANTTGAPAMRITAQIDDEVSVLDIVFTFVHFRDQTLPSTARTGSETDRRTVDYASVGPAGASRRRRYIGAPPTTRRMNESSAKKHRLRAEHWHTSRNVEDYPNAHSL